VKTGFKICLSNATCNPTARAWVSTRDVLALWWGLYKLTHRLEATLYKLTHSLEATWFQPLPFESYLAWFQPLHLECENPVQSSAFTTCNLSLYAVVGLCTLNQVDP
jgi:hypothetical protein